jgi:hypothetical protein
LYARRYDSDQVSALMAVSPAGTHLIFGVVYWTIWMIAGRRRKPRAYYHAKARTSRI